ncbi:MAG: TonB-dependent receptor [Acidiferrobacterales bacterium]|nr:TonB-dependent receptor [Acidiferrobacterales bacterium]
MTHNTSNFLFTNKKKLVVSAVIAAIYSGCSIAQEQDSSDSEENSTSSSFEVIEVTAQKRAQSIQEVPISITAFSGEFLEENGVETVQDVATLTPNFYISTSSQQTNNRISIRGIASPGNNAIEPSVGVFIDGVYYPRPGSVLGQLFDIDQFEVLRGPQGTLFGRNTPMGALNITTKNPKFYPEVILHAGVGNFGAKELAGTFSGGLNEEKTLAGRMSVKWTDRDGYAKNLFDGEDIGARDDVIARGKIVWDPTTDLNVKFSADFAKINSENGAIEVLNSTQDQNFDNRVIALYGGTPTTEDSFDWVINQDHRDQLKDEQYGFSVEVNYELESGLGVKLITAYRDWTADVVESTFRLPTNLLPRTTAFDTQTYSQEIQLISPGGETIDWIAGGFWYKEEYSINEVFDAGDTFCLPTVAGLAGPEAGEACAAAQQSPLTDTTFSQELDSLAFFGQATWNVSSDFSLTLGGRWTSDEKAGDFTQSAFNPYGTLVRANEEQLGMEIDDSKFTWFANTSWDLNKNMMVFATASTGYKSGGFNSQGGSSALEREQRIFAAEDTENIELGLKSRLLDGAMTANVGIYRTDIVDFQDRAFDGLSFVVLNAGEIRQQGIESDVNWMATEALRVVIGLSYLDSEYLEFSDAPGLPGGPVQDLKGETRNFSPKWQTSIAADYTGTLNSDLEWFAGASYSWIDDQNVGAVANNNPQSIQESYGLLNGRIGIRSTEGDWDLTLFGNNLTEKGYCTQMFDQPFGAVLGALNRDNNTVVQRCVLGDPRTIVARFTYRYE